MVQQLRTISAILALTMNLESMKKTYEFFVQIGIEQKASLLLAAETLKMI